MPCWLTPISRVLSLAASLAITAAASAAAACLRAVSSMPGPPAAAAPPNRSVVPIACAVGFGGAAAAGGPGIDETAREQAAAALAAAVIASDAAKDNTRLIGVNQQGIADAERLAEADRTSILDHEDRIKGLASLQSITVGTPASYSLTLDSQQASTMPLVLVLSADVRGNRAGQAFSWALGDVLWFGPASVAPELLFNIAGDVDLSRYRLARDQDIIDGRATAGILLARQEARTADGKAVAAQGDADQGKALAAANKARLDALPPAGGLTDADKAKLAGITRNDETAATNAADAALGKRIDALATVADPVFIPDEWVKNGDARAFTVRLDPGAIVAGDAKVKLTIHGVPAGTVAIAANQHTYVFAVSAADAGTITRAAGNAGEANVPVTVEILGARDLVTRTQRGLLHVVAKATVAGGGGAQRIAYWPALAWQPITVAGIQSSYWGFLGAPDNAADLRQLAAVYAALNGADPALAVLRLSQGTQRTCDIPLRSGTFGASAFLGNEDGTGVVAGFEADVAAGAYTRFWVLSRVGWGTASQPTAAVFRGVSFFAETFAAEVWKL